MPKHVAVIGAGVVGASIAWHLVRAGARVTILDQQEPGGVASPCSFGWTNATYHNPRHYYDLRRRSMQEWERLARDVEGLPYRRTGSLYFDFERVDVDDFFKQHTSWGYDLKWIDADEFRRLEPNIVDVPARALVCESEGAAEATATARVLVQRCIDEGADVRTGVPVSALLAASGRVTGLVVGGEMIEADEIVVAAGLGTPRIAATVGVDVPMTTSPGLILHTKPVPPVVTRMILASWLHVRQQADGTILCATDFGGGEINDDAERGAVLLLDLLKQNVRGCETVEIAGTTVGYRPTPADGFPIVGRPADLEGLYIATTHSGVTLAPAIGLFAALELTDRQRDPLLAPFGLTRFTA